MLKHCLLRADKDNQKMHALVQPLKTWNSSLCVNLNVIHGAKRSHLAQDYSDFCPWEERGETKCLEIIWGGCRHWCSGWRFVCESAAEVCPALSCSDTWQGSFCKGFWGNITGQSVLLGRKGGADTWALSSSALPNANKKSFNASVQSSKWLFGWKMSMFL